MSYVSQGFFESKYRGSAMDDEDFRDLSMRASELVEEMCMYKISEHRMDTYGTDTQDRIKKAVCAQIEYMYENGGSDMDTGTDLQSAGLGKFNYSKAAGADGNSKQSMYAPRALRILMPTGLLYRGG